MQDALPLGQLVGFAAAGLGIAVTLAVTFVAGHAWLDRRRGRRRRKRSHPKR